MDNDKGNKDETTLPESLSMLTSADLNRVISNVIIDRPLTKHHFLTNEPNPIKLIKFNFSGQTFIQTLMKAAGGGVVDVAHAVDPNTDPAKMSMAEFRAWKELCDGTYEVFMSSASRKPHIITKEQALQQYQQAKALLLAGDFTKEELEAEGLA